MSQEKRRVLRQQAEENFVARPQRQRRHGRLVHPLEIPLVAFAQRAGEARRREEVHVFPLPLVGQKRHHAAAAPVGQRQAGLLLRLAQEALVRRLVTLELAADADPFVVVEVVFLLHAVQHEILLPALDIAECGVAHGASSLSIGTPRLTIGAYSG